MVSEVPLTRGLVALVDDEDLPTVAALGKWQARKGCRTFYACKSMQTEPGRWVALMLHTLLTGWPLVDHRNGDGLDNRRANLRPATRSQNLANSHRRRDNASGYKGVHRHKGGRWVASIGHAGTQRYLGLFDTPEDAARAYDAAALDVFGEYARTNFPTAHRQHELDLYGGDE